jgi:hypothetical protein
MDDDDALQSILDECGNEFPDVANDVQNDALGPRLTDQDDWGDW